MIDPNSELLLEACVETLEQAVLAQARGAHRIELCADFSVGGLTPTESLLKKVQAAIQIPVMVMVRVRGGGFVYTKKEIEGMKNSIELCQRLQVAGVVFGFLDKKNEVDLELTACMARLASPLNVTFHKAIDLTPDPVSSIKNLSQVLEIQRVLTSGGAASALMGAPNLIRMKNAVDGKLKVLVGGGVTRENLGEVHDRIGAKEYHGRRIVF